MTKEQVLAINSLTQEQREYAERWFKVPRNAGQEMQGTTQAAIKAFIDGKIAEKKAKLEKNGSYTKVTDLIKSLCKGTKQQKALYTYKEIYEAIEQFTSEKIEKVNEINSELEELKRKAEEAGIKLKL